MSCVISEAFLKGYVYPFKRISYNNYQQPVCPFVFRKLISFYMVLMTATDKLITSLKKNIILIFSLTLPKPLILSTILYYFVNFPIMVLGVMHWVGLSGRS